MDLQTVLGDKALLASLTREYELLKATNADVDWQEWIRARLKRAAEKHSSHAVQQQPAAAGVVHQQQQHRTPIRPSVSLRTPSKTPARIPGISSSAGNSRRSSAADAAGDGQHQAAPPQPQQTDWRAHDVTNTQQAQQQADMQRPSLLRLHGSSGTPQQHAILSHGQTPFLPGQLCQGPQPHWVAAARLGTALQASKVVSTMHAAADRERRLAAAAAVARQQLDLGLDASAGLAGSEQQQLPAAAQEQLQHVVKLTQEVVEQNQLLQQAMLKQQAQLSQHQGLLATVLHQTGTAAQPTTLTPPGAPVPQAAAAGAACTSAGAEQLQQQLPPAAGDSGAAAASIPSQQQLHDQIKDSWLVKTLLPQQQQPGSSAKPGPAAALAPEFIRIAGAAKQQPKRPAAEQLQQAAAEAKQQPLGQGAAAGAAATAGGDADAAADRRQQLKGVLRQLLSQGAVGPLPGGLAGLMAGLKGLQTGTAGQQQADAPAKQSHVAAASLVALLQQQQQQQQGNRAQGGTQLSKAQQLVLQRRKAQQRQEEEERRRQQEQEAQEADASKPVWQSEGYVPPPARMLRVKKAGAADVWNAAPSTSPPGPARPQSSKAAGNKAAGNKAAGGKAQPPRRKAGQRPGRAAQPKSSAAGRIGSNHSTRQNLASVLYGSRWRVDGSLRRQQQQQQQWGQEELNQLDEGAADAWQPERYSPQRTRLTRAEEATPQRGRAGSQLAQHMYHQQQQQAPAVQAAGATHPEAAALQLQDPAALSSLLAALERVEQQEREIHDRWFGSKAGCSSGGSSAGGGSAAAEGPSAQPGSSTGQPGGDAPAPAHPAEPAAAVLPQQPASTQAALVALPLPQQDASLGEPQQQHEQQQQQSNRCGLSEAAIRSIKASRMRFLRHQATLDGTLHVLGTTGQAGAGAANSSSSRRAVLQPQQVVEAVADLLLEELVGAEAEELEGFCDALCEQLLEDEFADAA